MPSEPVGVIVARLLAVMQEVRDASSYELNPHGRDCPQPSISCGCARSRRTIAAWAAYHVALAEAGIAPLDAVERAARQGALDAAHARKVADGTD